MPAFSYQAIDPQGVTQRGILEADSERAVRSQLRARQLVPLDVAPVTSGTHNRDLVLWQRRVLNQTALTLWTRQLAGLVDAGLPLERALTALADEAPTPRQQALVAALKAEVNAGASFAQALAAYPTEFSPMYRAVIAAGEHSGQLGLVLERLADDLEARQALRSKVMAALLYPAIVTAIALLIVLFLLAYVVPQVASVFTTSQRALPLLTVVMLAISQTVQAAWGWALLVAVGMGVLTRLSLRQPAVREQWDAAWLRLPVVGSLARGYNAAQCARTLALLIGAGVPMLKALQTAADTLPNAALRADLVEAQGLVREGAPLGKALAYRQRLPGLLSMFARLGEQTGELPQMLQRAAQQLSNEVQRRALYWATLLEPLLIVGMGVIVMLIVLAVMLPIIQLNQLVR
ncbi:MAG: type secretion system protein [Pseudomonadota bacterium]|jgi:general secretion pathway protein F